MKIFLDVSCQVVFPSAVIYGVFCVEKSVDTICKSRQISHYTVIIFYFVMLFTTGKPVIKVSGFTRIWKPSTNEIDEYSTFFQDEVVFSPDADLPDLSLDDESKGTYLLIFRSHKNILFYIVSLIPSLF